MEPAALKRYRQKLLDLKAEIVTGGDIEIEPGRKDPAHCGQRRGRAALDRDVADHRFQPQPQPRPRCSSASWPRSRASTEIPKSFGLCTECEEPISDKRLQLMPYVELCVECQQATDGPHKTGGRRHLRDFR